MRSDSQTYETVAKNCSAFAPANGNTTYSNTTSQAPGMVSCVNCKHFTQEAYCELDLYDQIVENKNLL